MCTNGISPPYSRFAAPFALEGEQKFSRTFVMHSLETYDAAVGGMPKSVVDLACGVGTACRLFAQKMPSVIGVDSSADMIEMARRIDAQLAAVSCRVEYLKGDMRNFKIPTTVDLATCMYDSINFMMSESEMRAALKCVHRCLKVGGLFVFDMYTILGLSRLWGRGPEIHTNAEDFFVATHSIFNDETHCATKEFFGFTKQNDETWDRWREQHKIKAYSIDRQAALVSTSGFEVLSILQWNADGSLVSVSGEAHRVFFVTRRI